MLWFTEIRENYGSIFYKLAYDEVDLFRKLKWIELIRLLDTKMILRSKSKSSDQNFLDKSHKKTSINLNYASLYEQRQWKTFLSTNILIILNFIANQW